MSNQSLISTTSPSPPSWDVFLSFRGTDVRRSFISHLYFALDQAGIQTFRDEPSLEKGQEISSALLNAIEDSKMYVVVLSENYAHSSWCLDELVHILSSMTTENQIVPVFYYADPSDVRYLQKNYGTAFEKHEKRYTVGVINKWKSALAEISKLSGYHLRKEANQNESDIVQEIVSLVASQASIKQLHLEEYLYGIDSAVEEIYQKLRMELNDVRVIGICGMGGIGKTTTAKAFYNQYSNRFAIKCFIEDVKQYSQLSLLQQLLSELLRRRDYKVFDVKTGIRQLQSILHSNKALIILDDLDKSSHLEWLAKLCFSSGSRLVITTRDVNLLNQLKVDLSELEIYMVKKLKKEDSLELFCYHAFRKPMPPNNFTELSLSFVTYVEGLPLALKVLGASLRGKTDIAFWKAKYEKVKQIPENEIHKILRLSYDELADEMQKTMFLDIVFFFIGKNKAEAIDIFRSCALFPEVGIPILEDRFLISKGDMFEMHNLMEEMGREIIREESKHGNCIRLNLCQRNAFETLEYLELLGSLKSATMNYLKNLKRSPDIRDLKMADKLVYRGYKSQKIFHPSIGWLGGYVMNLKQYYLPKNNIKLLTNLTSLNLAFCKNLMRLPEQLGDMKGLKMIDASYTPIEQLPDSIVHLKQLGSLRLTKCRKLRNLPEQFGNMEGLEKFDVSQSGIEELPDSTGQLINLAHLDLMFCKSLTSLPDSIWKLKLLKELDLNYCSKLERLPEQLGEMISLEFISAYDTAIQEIPDSVGRLSRLKTLNVGLSKKLKDVPNSIWNLTSLVSLCLPCKNNFTSNLPPDTLKDMKKLVTLSLKCSIRLWLPMIQSLTSLEDLSLYGEGESLSSVKWFMNLSKLSNLKYLVLDNWGSSYLELPLNIIRLELHNNATVEQLPDLSNLEHLETLDIKNCIGLRSLLSLPLNLTYLSVDECTSLKDVPDLSILKKLKRLRIHHCSNLKSIDLKQSSLEGQRSFSAELPNKEIPEWLDFKSNGSKISFNIPSSSSVLGAKYLGIALWVVYKYKKTSFLPVAWIDAVITNKTEGIEENYSINMFVGENEEVQVRSKVECISRHRISIKSGDRIEVAFGMSYTGKVLMCGAHIIIPETTSSISSLLQEPLYQ